VANPVWAVLLVNLRADEAQRQLALNGIYIIGAGLLAGLLAIGVFWFITTRLVLSPVRVLRGTAEKVAEGDFNIRSDINTGDEFEQLSDMFNLMLEKIRRDQERLRDVNKGMDLKLDELARSNIALYEANKIKGEFLANVSHELRTPMHSIIGFAEVLQETLADRTGPVDEKRKRYTANIITSSKNLLDLITDLLDLAKIDAGRMELRVVDVNLSDTAEGMVMLIRPQAEKKQIDLRLQIEPGLPLIRTDAGKLHQVVFNFLSNAVKFTPRGGAVTVRVAMEPYAGGGGETVATPGDGDGRVRHVRISVTDTGPGIAPEYHEQVFEKFTQLDPVVTREHGGTGLGLTIARQLAELLRGRIELESDTGRGATFSLIVPTTLESRSVPLMPDLTAPGTPGSAPVSGSRAVAAES
jgi:signal transduction histidine kinase